jgi:3-oxoacyl-[acyl-carrier protein] reductase
MDLGLGGRGYLVTGASRGLGFAAAQALVVDGARVLVNARSADAVDAAVATLGGPPSAHGLAADLTDAGTADRLVAAARDRLGRVDGALISVGGPEPGTVLDTPEDAWREGVEGVLLGPLRLVRALVPHLAEGAVLGFVLSTSARSPLPDLAVSNGLRPGLAMTAKQLADELAPRGIRVVGLLPGTFATELVVGREEASGDPAGARARAVADIPLGRVGEPAEFGRVAAFLLSPAASYVTGTSVAVDGGRLRTP